jgi:hypothetical protein
MQVETAPRSRTTQPCSLVRHLLAFGSVNTLNPPGPWHGGAAARRLKNCDAILPLLVSVYRPSSTTRSYHAIYFASESITSVSFCISDIPSSMEEAVLWLNPDTPLTAKHKLQQKGPSREARRPMCGDRTARLSLPAVLSTSAAMTANCPFFTMSESKSNIKFKRSRLFRIKLMHP